MLKSPKFPEDFKVLYADGGVSYWHWHPDAPADYDGTWSAAGDPPPWSGGLMISTEESVQATLETEEQLVVSWEFDPETESGPYYRVPAEIPAVQEAVGRVIEEVNRQSVFA